MPIIQHGKEGETEVDPGTGILKKKGSKVVPLPEKKLMAYLRAQGPTVVARQIAICEGKDPDNPGVIAKIIARISKPQTPGPAPNLPNPIPTGRAGGP